MKQLLLFIGLSLLTCTSKAQQDSLDNARLAQMIQLSEVVVRSDINVAQFMERVKNDSTFYKAFRTLHIVGYTSLNDINIVDKKGKPKAGMSSRTKQTRKNNCRTMQTLSETTQGDFYNKSGNYNYYTAELYAGLFFTKGEICGESNIVAGVNFNPKGKKGLAKNKEQLKTLFFNPGKKIPGIPFIGDKINIFDPDVAQYYDFYIDQEMYEGKSCYVFSVKAKADLRAGKRDKIVIDNMITWFDARTMEVMARNYQISYDAGVYDFDVQMEVQMTKFGEHLVPKLLRYKGNWKVVMKPREISTFTATLFDFTE